MEIWTVLFTILLTTQVVMMLLSYNLAYALPFAMVPVLSALMGKEARPILAKVNRVMDKISVFLMPAMLGLTGLVLLLDAIVFLATGASLF